MSNFFERRVLNNSKKISEREKYSFISVEDLEKLKSRGLQLSEELKKIDIISDSSSYKEKLTEFYQIVGDLRKYKKYAKK